MHFLQLGLKGLLKDVKFSKGLLSVVGNYSAICHRQSSIRCYSLKAKQDLPSLPVAPLQQSLEKYLSVLKPIISDEDFAKTSQIVKEFGKTNGEGEALHRILCERAKSEANWVDEWWSRYGYQRWRDSLVVHINPGLFYSKQEFNGRNGQIRFAAKLLLGILDYKKMVDSGTIPVQKYGKDPLCMKQPYIVMNSCRIPGEEEDGSYVHDPEKPEGRAGYVVAMHNNQFFCIDLYDESGKQLNLTQLQEKIGQAIDMSPSPGPPVGVLTAMDRTSWAKVYKKLIKDSTNSAILERIQKSLLVVCLDQPSFHNFPDDKTGAAANSMHGSGSQLNSGNRWFDKTMQAIVTTDGGLGANLEHLLAEAVAQSDVFDHALDHMAKRVTTKSLPVAKTGPPQKLEFNLTNDLLDDIEVARKQLDSLVDNIELAPRLFTWYGKNFIKHYRMSPDAYLQVCLQWAYYRLHGHPVSTYETGSTKKFRYGRTETVRSCTTEALEFSKGMESKTCKKQEKIDLLTKAVEKHSSLSKEAMAGEGIDRLLFGMKIAAIESGREVPEVYNDPSYKEAMRFRISTSQVPSKHGGNVYFGPSEQDGYGMCYNIMSDQVIFTVSAFKDNDITSAKKFADVIETSLRDVQLLLFGRKSEYHQG
ncbi:carnitine O-acetyltransferase-like [Lineus longissimus]|uniref:carnitine O-acetyltransferase-like n=1 Tax=Lineus longissimus TaxID=88925 RepID=UPI002B4C2AC1